MVERVKAMRFDDLLKDITEKLEEEERLFQQMTKEEKKKYLAEQEQKQRELEEMLKNPALKGLARFTVSKSILSEDSDEQ